MIEWAVIQMGAPLLVTLVAAVIVAAFFGLKGAGLGAVVGVNLVTVPIMYAIVLTLYWLGIGYGYDVISGRILAAGWTWPVLGAIEVIIIIAGWRLLVWALDKSAGSSRRLLALAMVMNVGSAIVGTAAVWYMLTLRAG